MGRINLMKGMNGNECWTNAFGDRFGERVCIGIEERKESININDLVEK